MKLHYKDCGKIGFTCSTFDLLHAGHVTMLEEAKRHCDFLIVGLQNDPTEDRPEKNKPEQSIVERQIQLAAVKYVDEIVIYNTEQDLMDSIAQQEREKKCCTRFKAKLSRFDKYIFSPLFIISQNCRSTNQSSD